MNKELIQVLSVIAAGVAAMLLLFGATRRTQSPPPRHWLRRLAWHMTGLNVRGRAALGCLAVSVALGVVQVQQGNAHAAERQAHETQQKKIELRLNGFVDAMERLPVDPNSEDPRDIADYVQKTSVFAKKVQGKCDETVIEAQGVGLVLTERQRASLKRSQAILDVLLDDPSKAPSNSHECESWRNAVITASISRIQSLLLFLNRLHADRAPE